MITKEQLRIFELFRGNTDALARVSKRVSRPTNEDWRVIDELLRDLFLVQSGLPNVNFEARVLAKAAEVAENELVCQRLVEIARLSNRRTEKWLIDHNLLR